MKTTYLAKSEWTVLQNLPFAQVGEILINENGKWKKSIKDGYHMEDYSDFLDKITNIKFFGIMPYDSAFITPLFMKRFSVPSIVNQVLESLQYGEFHDCLQELANDNDRKEVFIYEIFRSLLKKANVNE